MKLAKHDHIVAVAAEPASRPGWSNTPLWVFIQDGHGQIRCECLQPMEQSDGMRLLYATAAAVHAAMAREVERVAKRSKATK